MKAARKRTLERMMATKDLGDGPPVREEKLKPRNGDVEIVATFIRKRPDVDRGENEKAAEFWVRPFGSAIKDYRRMVGYGSGMTEQRISAISRYRNGEETEDVKPL